MGIHPSTAHPGHPHFPEGAVFAVHYLQSAIRNRFFATRFTASPRSILCVCQRIDGPKHAGIDPGMKTMGFTYWQDGAWLGYLDEFPDYMTQESSLENLREHLLDLHQELTLGVIPNVRRHSVL